MPLLSYIDDNDLYAATEKLVLSAKNAAAKVELNPYRNVIDPFSALIDASRQGITLKQWMQQEVSRQTQKGFQNALGEFHQSILGSVHDWVDTGRGGSIDVKSEDKQIIAEVKNKFNTMNSGTAEQVYIKLANHLRYSEKNYTAYVVAIVPKNPTRYNKPWSPNKQTMLLREDIREIDGFSFYALATGEEQALYQLYEVLPLILARVLESDTSKLVATTEFTDLFDKAYK